MIPGTPIHIPLAALFGDTSQFFDHDDGIQAIQASLRIQEGIEQLQRLLQVEAATSVLNTDLVDEEVVADSCEGVLGQGRILFSCEFSDPGAA